MDLVSDLDSMVKNVDLNPNNAIVVFNQERS